MRLLHRRVDGSFVVEIDTPLYGRVPYHVIPGDPLFAVAEAAARGRGLPDEPEPPPLPPDRRIALTAFLDRLAAPQQRAVAAAAQASPALLLWLLRVGASCVDLDAPATAEAVAALLAARAIAPADAAALVA